MNVLCSEAWGDENSFFCDKYNIILSFVRLAGLLERPGLDAAQGPGWPDALLGLAGLLASCLLRRLPSWAWLPPAGWLPAWLRLACLLDGLGGLGGPGLQNVVRILKGCARYAPNHHVTLHLAWLAGPPVKPYKKQHIMLNTNTRTQETTPLISIM